MGLINKILGKRSLSKEEVAQAFKQSCWDLYVSSLPDPRIVDANNKDDKKAKEEFIPKGFFIDPRTWTITFNTNDLPKQIEEIKKQFEYARSIFHHETTHFTKVPGDELLWKEDLGIKDYVQVDAQAQKHLLHKAIEKAEQGE